MHHSHHRLYHPVLPTYGAQKKTAKTNMLTQDSKKFTQRGGWRWWVEEAEKDDRLNKCLDNKKLGELRNKDDATPVVQA
ncbi:hypothetical protein Tco_0103239 [Tanacetum coccineum]